MQSKKGLELSMTIIVLMIISVIVFIGGVSLVWKMFAGAEEIKAGLDKQTSDQIEALLREGTELVAIPINTKQSAIGKETTFGLGIRNLAEEGRGYYVLIGFSNIYDRSGKPIAGGSTDYIEKNWLGGFKLQGPFYIGHNKYEIVPLRVRTARINEDMPTPKGSTTVFNVCVFDQPVQEGTPCDPGARSIVYDKIRQIFIEIR